MLHQHREDQVGDERSRVIHERGTGCVRVSDPPGPERVEHLDVMTEVDEWVVPGGELIGVAAVRSTVVIPCDGQQDPHPQALTDKLPRRYRTIAA